jgi:hypothetical protein
MALCQQPPAGLTCPQQHLTAAYYDGAPPATARRNSTAYSIDESQEILLRSSSNPVENDCHADEVK